MSELPPPTPSDEDAELAEAFSRMKAEVRLRGQPDGDQRCDNCHFMVEPDAEISWCWNERVEALVGRQWWCDRWEPIGTPEAQMTDEHQSVAMRRRFTVVEDQQWIARSKYGETCAECFFYLSPGESVSYCWHPNLRVGVGHDHWCQWWEPLEGGEVGGPGD